MSREEEHQEVLEKIIDILDESSLSMGEKIGVLSVLQFSLMHSAVQDE